MNIVLYGRYKTIIKSRILLNIEMQDIIMRKATKPEHLEGIYGALIIVGDTEDYFDRRQIIDRARIHNTVIVL